MRRIDGWLSSESGEAGDLAPFVRVVVEYGRRRLRYDFLIDTGSDITSLMPDDAYHLLGDSFLKLDFEHSTQAIVTEGIGTGGQRQLPIDAVLTLEDDVDVEIALPVQLWVAEPRPDYVTTTGNWAIPSILGRDAIRPGDFELSYINGTVTLIRPDNE